MKKSIDNPVPSTIISVPPIISRIQRNHGLEHATMHVLAQRNPRRGIAGHSDMGGFWIVGDVLTEELTSTVQEALQRMRAGEHQLAIHPNCGTNFAASGIIAGVAAFIGMWGAGHSWRAKLERLPLVATLATLALILSQPLGYRLQERVTTSGKPGDLEVVAIKPTHRGRVTAHRILTRG